MRFRWIFLFLSYEYLTGSAKLVEKTREFICIYAFSLQQCSRYPDFHIFQNTQILYYKIWVFCTPIDLISILFVFISILKGFIFLVLQINNLVNKKKKCLITLRKKKWQMQFIELLLQRFKKQQLNLFQTNQKKKKNQESDKIKTPINKTKPTTIMFILKFVTFKHLVYK